MNRLFYIIYNSYYKHGEYKNDNPSLTVGGIFMGCFFCIALSILNIIGWINPLYYRLPKLSKPILFLITILFGIIVYFVFYHNKRYQKIYETYKENIFLNSKRAKYLGFLITILIIISPFILALVRNKICLGHWV
jgi:glucan phosphoethanolaminetransferase (alkaline phosphatase superfamily)